MDELDIIHNYLRLLANSKESLALMDDAASITNLSKYKNMLVTTDTIIEKRHFFNLDNPASIATKLLHTSISDICAMGGVPKYWLFSLSIPTNQPKINDIWFINFIKALDTLQKETKCKLIGGDTTTSTTDLVLSSTIIGYLEENSRLLKTSSAKIDDLICVSGPVGDGFLGYKLLDQIILDNTFSYDMNVLSDEDKQYLINKYLFPKAELQLGKILSKYANSCTDISDGLFTDLLTICNASNMTALINVRDIPISSPAKKLIKDDIYNKINICRWGDDYKLLFTISKKKFTKLQQIYKKPIYVIGKISERRDSEVILYNNNNILDADYSGFKHNIT